MLRAKFAESMDERAVIEKGIETLESVGQGESTMFVLLQELTSLKGCYGKHLTGSDTKIIEDQLDSLEFDEEICDLLELELIEEIPDTYPQRYRIQDSNVTKELFELNSVINATGNI